MGQVTPHNTQQLEQTKTLAELRHLQEHRVTPKAMAGTSGEPGAGHGLEDATAQLRLTVCEAEPPGECWQIFLIVFLRVSPPAEDRCTWQQETQLNVWQGKQQTAGSG